MYYPRQQAIFENRRDAGRQLAVRLLEYEGQGTVVLAIPNGGVPVGLEVATVLKAAFDIVLARKIPIPLKPEAGFGAVTDDGTIILNEELVKSLGLSREQIEYQVSQVRAKVRQRSLLYHGDRPLTSITGKTVIIIDDGLASGGTMMAAAESVRRRRAKEIIVAVPAASGDAVDKLERAADRVVTMVTTFTPRFAVADFYQHWYDLSDDEVVRYIREWRSRRFHRNEPEGVSDTRV